MQLLHHEGHISSGADSTADTREYIGQQLVANSCSSTFDVLQKESAHTQDINRLILAAQEIGLMGSLFHKNVRNSTECQTWQQLQESHKVLGDNVSFRVANPSDFSICKDSPTLAPEAGISQILQHSVAIVFQA